MKKLIGLVIALSINPLAQAEKIAIVGGTIHTMSDAGTLTNQALLMDGNKIIGFVGTDAVPAEYTLFDAKDKVVTPGLIVSNSQLGLVEVGFSAGIVDSSADHSEFSPLGAAADVSYAINPASSLMGITRMEGVTLAGTSMNYTHAMFQGQGAVISLSGAEQPVVKSAAFMPLNVSGRAVDGLGGSRALLWPQLISALDEAKTRNGKPLGLNEEYHGALTRADLNSLIQVVSGKVRLLVEVQRAADIRQVLSLVKRYPDMQLALSGASEAWMVAGQIAEAGVPVVINPESNLPYDFDQLAATLANAGRLADAGVSVSIGMNTHNARLITQYAGNAVANGLSWQDGLAALTINPARMLGVDNQYGSLESGKQADVVIWSGDPLEVMEVAEQVFIGGEAVDMQSRQTKLRDRYLHRDPAKPAPYTRP